MINTLKPYPEYSSASLPWIDGLVPGWKVLRGKGVFAAVDIRSQTGKEELLSVSASDGVVPRSQKNVTMFKAKSYIGHKLCWPGDLVVNSLWAWMQGLGVSRYHGLVSSAYSVYRPRPDFAGYGRFFHYLIRSNAYKWELQTRSKGVWVSRLQLSDPAFMDMPILLPPPDEQAAIVRFLDYANQRLEKTIRAKLKVITLLIEQKQAIIHHAITRGRDPNVPLKPSGIPWLGEIPKHWVLKRFKFIATINSGQVDPKRAPYRDMVLIAPNHIEKVTGKLLYVETATEQGADSGKYLVGKGQLIYSKIRPNLRKVVIAPFDCLCSADMYPISPKLDELSAEYLKLLLLSEPFTKYAIDCSMRVAMPKVNRDALANCWMWYPSKQGEQMQILDAVVKESAPFDTAINRAEREITLLREYRTRLTADVVTGKLDVREAARDLPEEQAEEVVFPQTDEEETENETELEESATIHE